MSRNEVGKFPLSTKIWSQMVKYFLRLSQRTKNKIIDDAFDCAISANTRWVQTVSRLLKTNGFTNILLCPINIDKEAFQKQFIQRCRDIYLQNLLCPDSNRLNDYLRVRERSDDYGFQSYLEKVKIVEHRTTLTRLRTGCTCLALDTGRFENIPRENRIRPLCKSGVEDAKHFLFECK